MNTLQYKFEELPDFFENEFRSGAHNGTAEISYSHSGEWYVSAISLECHNGRLGDKAASKIIPLAHSDVLREKLVAALEQFSFDHIQDAVNGANEADESAAAWTRAQRYGARLSA